MNSQSGNTTTAPGNDSSAQLRIVGITGNHARPSRTRVLVQAILDEVAARGLGATLLHDLTDAGPGLGQTIMRSAAVAPLDGVLHDIETADALVVGTPVYKGAYTGLFKHLFDLLDMNILAGKPVLLTATGAAPQHAAVIDYHLRPLFLFFGAQVASRSIYALNPDFETPDRLNASMSPRIAGAVDELTALLKAFRG